MTEKMMRVAGRRDDNTSTALRADSKGNLSTISNTEALMFTKDNVGIKITQEQFLRRTVGQTEMTISHANKINFSTNGGVFDQIIMIEHTFDKPVTIAMYVGFIRSEEEGLWAYEIFSDTMPKADGYYRLTLTPEKSIKVKDGMVTSIEKRAVIEVPELRQPISHFHIVLNHIEAPTTGELKVYLSRRY